MQNTESGAGERLRRLAQEILAYQELNGLSDAQLCKNFAGLGSTKTYKRILEGDLSELNVDRQFENYSQVLELTKIKRDPNEEKMFDDLRHVRKTLLAVAEAYQERGNDRFIILEGQTGSGKSKTLDIVESRYGNAVVSVEAHGGWKIGNNPLKIMAADILQEARLREYSRDTHNDKKAENKIVVSDTIPVSFAACKAKLFEALLARKRILSIDEGQEMGPFCLNFLKSIINQTPTVVVLAVIPTIFRRLESRSYDDCVQLTGNRLYERIRIPSPEPDEIEKVLDRRGVKFVNGDGEKCVAKLAEMAPMHANWKFISRFARRAKAAKGGVDVEQCVEHIRAIEKSRKGT